MDFQPHADSVIMGRGTKYRNVSGNKRLRALAKTVMKEYSEANSKRDKSRVISHVLEMKLSRSEPDTAFVRQVNGRWWSVGEDVMREKIGYVFRDLLNDKYLSSSASKTAKRKQFKKLEGRKQELLTKAKK